MAVLNDRVAELEHKNELALEAVKLGGGGGGGGRGMLANGKPAPPRGALKRSNTSGRLALMAAKDEGNWKEEMLARAEKQLQAAMEANDATAIRAALAKAGRVVDTIKGAKVVQAHQVLRGKAAPKAAGEAGGADGEAGEGGEAEDAVAPLSPLKAHRGEPPEPDTEKGRYLKFHRLATARKLALASHDYEVCDVRIEKLFDEAERRHVAPQEYHAFLRDQLPSPRAARMAEAAGMLDTDDTSPYSRAVRLHEKGSVSDRTDGKHGGNMQKIFARAFVDGLKQLKETGSSAGPARSGGAAPIKKVRRYKMHAEIFEALQPNRDQQIDVTQAAIRMVDSSGAQQEPMHEAEVSDAAQNDGDFLDHHQQELLPEVNRRALVRSRTRMRDELELQTNLGVESHLEQLAVLQKPTWMSEEQAKHGRT